MGMSPADEAQLDNPAYAALCGAHARFAQVRGRARRYPVDVAPFLALPSPPSAQDWRDAAGLVAPGTYAAVRYSDAELPDAWQAVEAFDLVQMIGERVIGADCPGGDPARRRRCARDARARRSDRTGAVSDQDHRAWRLPGDPLRRGSSSRWPASGFVWTVGPRSAPSAPGPTIAVGGWPLGSSAP